MYNSMRVSKMKHALIEQMKEYFGDDQPRIDHALSVLNYAQQIQPELNARLDIVQAAAILHDIGIQAAQLKHGSCKGRFQEIEGPPIATHILKGSDFTQNDITHICNIIANHHSGNFNSPEFTCIWDADWIVNLGADFANRPRKFKENIIQNKIKTKTAKQIASNLDLL